VSKALRIVRVALGAVSILTFAASRAAHADASPPFPDMGSAAKLELTDARSGRPLMPSLRGKAILVSFIASTCRETCPMTEATFASVARRLQALSDTRRVAMVLVTVDPVTDTVPKLCAFARSFSTHDGTIAFATGSRRTVTPLLERYDIDVRFKREKHDDPDHTAVTYLIDPHWHVRYEFGSNYGAASIARLTERFVRSDMR